MFNAKPKKISKMKKNLFILIALMFTFVISKAQQNVYLNINHKLGGTTFALNQIAQNDIAHNFKVTRLDYYLSSIKIIHDGGQELAVENKYILVRGGGNLHELLGSFAVTNVEGITFSIGVEAPTNNADPSLWPGSHPLSPKSPSMHWGWSAGYLFAVVEGVAGNNFDKEFQIHGLKNPNYYTQTQMAAGIISGNEININLEADIAKALKGIDVNSGPIDHGSNATDLDLLRNFRDEVFSPASVTSIESKVVQSIRVFPNPSHSVFYIDNSHPTHNADQVIVFDLMGRIIFEQKLDISVNTVELPAVGIFSLMLMKEGEILGTKQVVQQ